MSQRRNPVVVGGGQTGIASSYYLKQEGRERVVLERAAHPLNREAVHAETAFDEWEGTLVIELLRIWRLTSYRRRSVIVNHAPSTRTSPAHSKGKPEF